MEHKSCDFENENMDKSFAMSNLTPDASITSKKALKCGYMSKLGSNVMIWKRRFFVLRPMTMLYYYLSEYDTEPRGCIDMDVFTCVRKLENDESEKSRFELTTSGLGNGQKILLEARNEEEGKSWIHALTHETFDVLKAEKELLKYQNDHFQSEIDVLETQIEQLQGYAKKYVKAEMILSQEKRGKAELLDCLQQLEKTLRLAFSKLGIFCNAPITTLECKLQENDGTTPEVLSAQLGERTREMITKMNEMVERLMNVGLEYQNAIETKKAECRSLKTEVDQLKQQVQASKIEKIALESLVQKFSCEQEELVTVLRSLKKKERTLLRELKVLKSRTQQLQSNGVLESTDTEESKPVCTPEQDADTLASQCNRLCKKDSHKELPKQVDSEKQSVNCTHPWSRLRRKETRKISMEGHVDIKAEASSLTLQHLELAFDSSALRREIQIKLDQTLRSAENYPLPRKGIVRDIAQESMTSTAARMMIEKTGGAASTVGGIRSWTGPLISQPQLNSLPMNTGLYHSGFPEEAPARSALDSLLSDSSLAELQIEEGSVTYTHLSQLKLRSFASDDDFSKPREDETHSMAGEEGDDNEEEPLEYNITFDSQTIGLQFAFIEGRLIVKSRNGYLFENDERPRNGAILTAINGKSIHGRAYEELVKILKTTKRPMVCTFKEEPNKRASSFNMKSVFADLTTSLQKKNLW